MVPQLLEAYLAYLPWMGIAIGTILMFFSAGRAGRRPRLFKIGFAVLLVSITGLLFQLTS